VRAALIREVARQPELVGDHDEPRGDLVVHVTAAPVNPVDLSIAAGRYYVGTPNTPYVPGVEGVGRTAAGERYWFETGAGYLGDGAMAERATVRPDAAIELRDDIGDATAGCLGVAGLAAWVPLTHRARVEQGETVLVLGATGIVGEIAVQAAKLLGAGKVIAAGRDEARLARVEADERVKLPTSGDALREAAGGLIDVVIDPLWGEHGPVATEAMNLNGRLVVLGQSAGQQSTLDAGVVRGKALRILGHSNATTPAEVKREAFDAMCEHAAAGRLHVDYEEIPLDDVAAAWERQAASPHVKLILVP
jgi:NADPH:quinone reductase